MPNTPFDPDAPSRQPTALVLQGGGALGAYQAGVYEELLTTRWQPDWVVGVSIGAINAALIAGNPPERRIERLREFWELVSSGALTLGGPWLGAEAAQRTLANQWSALLSMWVGIPGFYRPRFPPAALCPDGSPGALSVYDTAPLRDTLARLVDFGRINRREVRLSVGAVGVRSGNSVYFDSSERPLGPEHVMASGALPPAFPPVEIDGEAYWDGGLVSNTPLQFVLDAPRRERMRVLQVDLFSARGAMPANLDAVQQRQKDIVNSSRTRFGSDMAAKVANQRQAIRDLLLRLPDALRDDPSVTLLAEATRMAPVDVIHLIYREKPYELESKDYEFSRASVLEHWQAGRRDMRDTLDHPEWLVARGLGDGITQYDLGPQRASRAAASARAAGQFSRSRTAGVATTRALRSKVQ